MINLDYLCIKHAQQMPRNKESEINMRKALGVLKEDGVYAMFLFLEDKDKSRSITKNLICLLNTEEIKMHFLSGSKTFPDNFKEFCEELRNVVMDLDKLLFLKKILEKILIYALYHAKIGEG